MSESGVVARRKLLSRLVGDVLALYPEERVAFDEALAEGDLGKRSASEKLRSQRRLEAVGSCGQCGISQVADRLDQIRRGERRAATSRTNGPSTPPTSGEAVESAKSISCRTELTLAPSIPSGYYSGMTNTTETKADRIDFAALANRAERAPVAERFETYSADDLAFDFAA